MKNVTVFGLGVAAGLYLGYLLSRITFGDNSGSEFWGDQYAEITKGKHGFGNNSGSKFYSDLYIREKFKNWDEPPAKPAQ